MNMYLLVCLFDRSFHFVLQYESVLNRLSTQDRVKYDNNLTDIADHQQEILSKEMKYMNNPEKCKMYCRPILEEIQDLERENQSLLGSVVHLLKH